MFRAFYVIINGYELQPDERYLIAFFEGRILNDFSRRGTSDMDFSSLLPGNPADFIMLVIGLAVGIFYGFDGWRGSLEKVELKDSPRFRNFRYAAAVAVTTFIADLKVLDPNIQKLRLLAFYLASFLVSAFLTVFGWALYIAVTCLFIKRADPANSALSTLKHVGNYLLYGHKHHIEKLELSLHSNKESEIRRLRRDFLPSYASQLSHSLGAIYHYRAQPAPEARKLVARNILKTICAVVQGYRGKHNDIEIDANYMVAYDKSSAPRSLPLRFAWGEKGRYKHFLALETYADDMRTKTFALPVEDESDPQAAKRVLPGAPRAFFNDAWEIIDSTARISYPEATDKAVLKDMKDYFRQSRFKSFASLPIIGKGGKKLGIVNIDSNQEFVFGKTEDEKNEIASLVYPFCLLLGLIIEP